jgi:hypothetical protein
VGDLELACGMVRAYRRRRLSEKHKARFVAAGHQFSSRRHEWVGTKTRLKRF